MMEAASTSEMSVNFYQTTQCNNPGKSSSHLLQIVFIQLGFLHIFLRNYIQQGHEIYTNNYNVVSEDTDFLSNT
jgi:hypothetical protein